MPKQNIYHVVACQQWKHNAVPVPLFHLYRFLKRKLGFRRRVNQFGK